MFSENTSYEQDALRDAYKVLLGTLGFQSIESLNEETADWKVETFDSSYLVKVLTDQDIRSLYGIVRNLHYRQLELGFKGSIVLYHRIIPKSKSEYFVGNFPLKILDACAIGAHLEILLAHSQNLEDEGDFVSSGHYALEGDDLHRSATIFVDYLPEGHLRFSGSATYGNLRGFGPNMGFFEFVADDLKDRNARLFILDDDWKIPEQSAASYGNTVIFESTAYSDEPYRAIFTFKKFGLVVEERNFQYAPFGHNVSLSGFYEKAIFPSATREYAAVSDDEIFSLSWNFKGVFRSIQVGALEIRLWLNQFAPDERRPMFYLLQRVRFFNSLMVREAVEWLHLNTLKSLEIQRNDTESEKSFLITAFGNPAKSGSTLARIYRSTNRLVPANVAHFEDIKEQLEQNTEIKHVVCVEDVIGSGEDMLNFLRAVDRKFGQLLAERNISVIIQSICALTDGVKKIESEANNLKYKFTLKYYELMDKCFSQKPEYCNIDEDWDEIMRIAEKYGRRLRPDKPLGYGDSQMLVVFHDNCPNNTLPILWAQSKEIEFYWQPLFPRE